jgi:hypothetical protein
VARCIRAEGEKSDPSSYVEKSNPSVNQRYISLQFPPLGKADQVLLPSSLTSTQIVSSLSPVDYVPFLVEDACTGSLETAGQPCAMSIHTLGSLVA